MSEVIFDSKKHEYYFKGKKLISATEFIKSFFEPFDIKEISKLVAKARRKKGEKNSKGKPINAWDVRREWKQKAKDGTKVHKELEDYINHEPLEYSSKAKQGINFILNNELDLEKCYPEVIIHNDIVAGTIDLLYFNEDSSVTLIDWKTNKSIRKNGKYHYDNPLTSNMKDCPYTHYTLQLSLYAYILEQQDYTINKLLLVHLMDNQFKVYEVEYEKRLIEEAIEWHRKNLPKRNQKKT